MTTSPTAPPPAIVHAVRDRVECTYRGDVLAGIVAAVRNGQVKVFLDGGMQLTGKMGAFRPSTRPIPEADLFTLKGHAKLARVQWDDKGTIRYGTVTKTSMTRVTVVQDGGEIELKGSPSAFHPSKHPLVLDDSVSPASRWGVSGYRVIPGHDDCTPFAAKITLNGKPVFDAGNSGHGGCNEYHGRDRASQALVREFTADCRAWAEQLGMQNAYEADSLWIDWTVNKRPFGSKAADYIGSILL
jgi:hypothetical protein